MKGQVLFEMGRNKHNIFFTSKIIIGQITNKKIETDGKITP